LKGKRDCRIGKAFSQIRGFFVESFNLSPFLVIGFEQGVREEDKKIVAK